MRDAYICLQRSPNPPEQRIAEVCIDPESGRKEEVGEEHSGAWGSVRGMLHALSKVIFCCFEQCSLHTLTRLEAGKRMFSLSGFWSRPPEAQSRQICYEDI